MEVIHVYADAANKPNLQLIGLGRKIVFPNGRILTGNSALSGLMRPKRSEYLAVVEAIQLVLDVLDDPSRFHVAVYNDNLETIKWVTKVAVTPELYKRDCLRLMVNQFGAFSIGYASDKLDPHMWDTDQLSKQALYRERSRMDKDVRKGMSKSYYANLKAEKQQLALRNQAREQSARSKQELFQVWAADRDFGDMPAKEQWFQFFQHHPHLVGGTLPAWLVSKLERSGACP